MTLTKTIVYLKENTYDTRNNIIDNRNLLLAETNGINPSNKNDCH
jgi:hypothetical protein